MSETSSISFFLAGTMQGASRDISVCSQDYRSAIKAIIRRHVPNNLIHCPYEILLGQFANKIELVKQEFCSLREHPTLAPDIHPDLVRQYIQEFRRLTRLASETDVLIAYLPGCEPSMGTAMEMWSAFAGRKTIITISTMTQNLAILATSDLVISSLDELPALLTGSWLTQQLAKRKATL